MKEKTFEKLIAFFLAVLFGVILGYGWRIHHEIKSKEKEARVIKKEFVVNMFLEAQQGRDFIYERLIEVKPRRDGSAVVKLIK